MVRFNRSTTTVWSFVFSSDKPDGDCDDGGLLWLHPMEIVNSVRMTIRVNGGTTRRTPPKPDEPSYSYSMKWYSYSKAQIDRVRVPQIAEYEYEMRQLSRFNAFETAVISERCLNIKTLLGRAGSGPPAGLFRRRQRAKADPPLPPRKDSIKGTIKRIATVPISRGHYQYQTDDQAGLLTSGIFLNLSLPTVDRP